MSHLSRDPSQRANRDPQLGGDRALKPPRPEYSGLEPMLGGIRRAGPDMRRIQALLETPDAETRARLIEHVVRVGQVRQYAEELILVVPARARQKSGNWRGTFTPTQRIAAMEALALIGGVESIGVLLATLPDSIYEVRHAADRALTAICRRLDTSDPASLEVIRMLVCALGVLPMSARKVVARILSEIPADAALGPLLREGLTAVDWCARRESAWVLGALGDKRATKRLIGVLGGDTSDAVRATAAWALGQLDAPIALEPLAEASKSEDEIVRAAAVEAIGEHATRLAERDENYHAALRPLVSALQDEDWSVRAAAVDALMALDLPEARLALHRMLKQ